MRRILTPFLALSALGFIASAIVHILALAGLTLPIGDGVFVLHVGIFAVWFPAVIAAMRLGRGADRGGWLAFGSSFDRWKAMLAGCPDWMRYALVVLFVYAFANFFLGMRNLPHGASHKWVISSTSNAEAPALTVRLFSGHWLVFYGAAFAILYSAWRRPALLGTPTCANGHKALPTDNFCPACGAVVNHSPLRP